MPGGRGFVEVEVDEDRGKLYSFGGQYRLEEENKWHFLNDLHQLDLHSFNWKKIESPIQPIARVGHRTVLIKKLFVFKNNKILKEKLKVNRNSIFMFGGTYVDYSRVLDGEYFYLNDLWKFDLEKKSWEKLNTLNTPSPRHSHNLLHRDLELILIGGNGNVSNRTQVNLIFNT